MQPSHYPQSTPNFFNPRTLVAPAGAFIAFFGFFMPWVYVGAFIVGKNFAGYELGFFVWPIPLLCLLVIGAAFLPYLIRQVPILIVRVLALGCAGLSVLIMLFRLAYLTFEMRNMTLGSWSIQIGFFITFFGLCVTIVGALLLPTPQPK